MTDNPTREECEAILKLDVELLRHFRPDEIQNLIKSYQALLDECDNLRRDKERLDWLEAETKLQSNRKDWRLKGDTIREAIDAAISEEK